MLGCRVKLKGSNQTGVVTKITGKVHTIKRDNKFIAYPFNTKRCCVDVWVTSKIKNWEKIK